APCSTAWRCWRHNPIRNPCERAPMRVLFVLIVVANVWVYALGQGWLGSRPDDAGRDSAAFKQELNADKVKIRP
ncbi:MAG TPA: hypothetical protein VEA17_19960, partial [Bordetella sp.]|nr:hypothetical protein [Bordetella sp.]